MRMKTYMVNFNIGSIMCRLTTLTREFIHEYHSRYYNHRHAFFELHYVKEGRFLCKVAGESYELSAGQMILIQPGCDHAIVPLTDNKSKMCLGFDIFRNSTTSVSQEEQELIDLFYSKKVVVLNEESLSSGSMIISALTMLRTMYDQDNMTMITTEELKALMSLLVLGLCKELRECTAISEPTVPDETKTRNYWIDEFFAFNFNRNDGYELLAKQLNISTRQLDRLLKKTYGIGYQRRLIECRLCAAIDLLCDTDKPIEEISEIVGYGSTSSFTAFIKRETNRTPSQIRKERKA